VALKLRFDSPFGAQFLRELSGGVSGSRAWPRCQSSTSIVACSDGVTSTQVGGRYLDLLQLVAHLFRTPMQILLLPLARPGSHVHAFKNIGSGVDTTSPSDFT